jgi:3-methyladenine DNA glycosylase/8-oxoguanine DNA glycosylase
MSLYRDEYPLPPSISQREAVERVRALTDYWAAQYGTTTEWVDTRGTISGRVLGLSFQARFQVEPRRMLGELEVSFLAVKMGGRQYLKRKLDHYLDPDNSLEDLQAVVRPLSPAQA